MIKRNWRVLLTPLAILVSISLYAQNTPLQSSNYHNMAAGLRNSYVQFEQTGQGRIAFLGGSITYNGGWRDSLMAFFERRFPETVFEFVAAGIPSMGSTPSSFRLQRDVLSQGRIDLLFLEAAVNDATNGRSTKEQIRGMEGVVRHLRRSNTAADIVIMHFVDPDKMEAYRQGQEPQVITNHNLVASHYGIPTINLAKEVTDRIDNNEFTWEDDFVDLHPSPFGQGIYANSMITFLEQAYSVQLDNNDKMSAHPLPQKLDPYCYDHGRLVDISTIKSTPGWAIDPNWEPHDHTGTRNNYTAVPMLISDTPGAVISMDFQGNAVGIAVAAGQDAGVVEFRIDKGEWQKQDLFTRWSSQLHLPWYYTLASGLPDGKHQLEIRISGEKNPKSKGHACRIRYFFVNAY